MEHSWINLTELKDQLTRKLGPAKSQQYFDDLKRFLTLKINKIEFNKLCLTTVGKDNIPLHNQLIRSILKNTCTVKSKKARHENGPIPVVHKKGGKDPPLGIQNGLKKDGLLETIKLKEYMGQIVATHGLQGVSMECANVVNNGLDAYLKGVIRSFSKLSGSGSGSGYGQRARFGLQNGVISGCHYRMQECEPKRVISLRDFMIAVELNPRQLGDNWPVLLERICKYV